MKKLFFIAVLCILLCGFGLVSADDDFDDDDMYDDYDTYYDMINGSNVRIQKMESNDKRMENEYSEQIRNSIGDGARIKVDSNMFTECEDCELEEKIENGERKIFAKMSNGLNAEVKIMPDVVSEIALNRLRIKCNETNNCSLQLQEVGVGNQTRIQYEVQAKKEARVLGIFKTQMNVKANIDAETGEVIDIDKPWWAFLANEEDADESLE